MSHSHIHKKLRLQRLKHSVSEHSLHAQKKEETEQQLRNLISGAIFLEHEEKRKQIWTDALPSLTLTEMRVLSGAIIRENLRAKKRERNLQFEKIPQNISAIAA